MHKLHNGADLVGAQLLNAQLHQITVLGDLPTVDGAIGYLSPAGNKHIAFRDTEAGALILVPRLDRAETVTLQWSFSPASAMAPFTLGANALGQLVTGLNADQLDSYHTAAANTATTIPVRDAGGRMKASDPVDNLDVANKQWTLNTLGGALSRKQECKCGTKSNVTISSPPSTIDGVSLSNGDRILLLGQTAGSENGIYVYNGTGVALTRSTDADQDSEVNPGMQVFIAAGGTVYGATDWMLITEEPITVGTTALEFVQTAGAGQWQEGSGIEIDGQTVHVKIGAGGTPAGTVYTAKAIVQADTTSSLKQITLGTANQILGMNTGASDYEHKTISGTAGEIEVTHAANSITIGLADPVSVSKGGTGTASAQTQGQVIYAGVSGVFTSSSNLFWDSANSRLGIRTNTPANALTVADGGIEINHTTGQGQLTIKSGSSAQYQGSRFTLASPNTVDTNYAAFQTSYTINAADGGSMVLAATLLNSSYAFYKYLYTYDVDAHQWRFMADGSSKVYINSTGLGVNRAPTAYALEVEGIVNGKRYSTGFAWTANTKTSAIFEGSATGSVINIVSPNGYRSGVWLGRVAQESYGRIEYDHSNDMLELWANNSARVKIDSTGKVGVGRTPTTWGFEVQGSVWCVGNVIVQTSGSSSTHQAIRTDANAHDEECYYELSNTSTGNDRWRMIKRGPTNASPSNYVLYYYNGSYFTALTCYPTGEVRIGQSGSVAIGNITPSEKFDVDGNVRCAYLKLDRATTNTITLASPSGLASSLTFTFPATIPGAGYMRSDASGNMSITTTLDATTLTGYVPAGSIPVGGVTQHQASLTIDWTQLTNVPASMTPSSHVLATTSGLGPEHTVSGLTAGQVLVATGATTALFRGLQASDLPTDLSTSTTIGGAKVAFGGAFVLSSGTNQTVTHNLGTQYLIPFLLDTVDGSMDQTEVSATNDNQCSVTFRESPTASRFVLILLAIKE